jgi:hypothetical protein
LKAFNFKAMVIIKPLFKVPYGFTRYHLAIYPHQTATIAESNIHSSGHLSIDSEVLLLAFEPEEREIIRENRRKNTASIADD